MPLMQQIGKNNIVIVYENRDKNISLYGDQLKEIIQFDQEFFKDCFMISLEKILKSRSKLNVLISIHPYIIGITKSIAKYNIRLAYSIAKKDWQFGPINKHYDLILTQGCYSSVMLQGLNGSVTKEIGYPRYTVNGKRNTVPNEDKKVITFFPTLGSHGVLDLAEQIKLIDKKYKIIIKLHPLEKKELLINYTSSLKNCKIISQGGDNQNLIEKSDLVIHDTGGTCFSSLYLNANFCFVTRDFKRKKLLLSHTPEEILFFMINRKIGSPFMLNDIESFISNPLEYDLFLLKLKKIFFASNQELKIDKTLKLIYKINSKVWLFKTLSSSIILTMAFKLIGACRCVFLEIKLRKILRSLNA
jgi:hypothetical protein